MLCFKEHIKCVCVEYKMVLFNMCVRLAAIQASTYDIINVYLFCSVFAPKHGIE
jgi:hypothetical protein